MTPHLQLARAQTRRQFLKNCQVGLGAIALASLIEHDGRANPSLRAGSDNPLSPKPPLFPAKAKNVIYLHMSGAPPQQELFDYKPKLVQYHMKPCPDEWIKGKKFPFIVGHPNLLGTLHRFRQYGKSG